MKLRKQFFKSQFSSPLGPRDKVQVVRNPLSLLASP